MKFLPILALASVPATAAFGINRPVTSRPTASTLGMSSNDDAARSPNPAIKIAAAGMSLLKPLFKAEAVVQAKVLGAAGGVDPAAVAGELAAAKKANKVLIYTYGLSPFSTEALAMLDASGYEYSKIELGLEWFLLGGEGSETRMALSKEVESGATSLPKIFIGGECVGGCSELAALVESGDLDEKMKNARVQKKRP